MSARRLILSVLAALLLWPIAAHGQSPELVEVHERYSELYAQGRYQEAIPFAEEAVTLGEREFDPECPNAAASQR